MKLVKKKAAILFLLVVISLILTACGKLSGKYYLKDSYGMQYLEFNGDQVTITTFGIPVSGTYKIKGNQMTVKTNVLGYESETPYSFKKSGNSLLFEGQTYIKAGTSGESSNVGIIIVIVLIIFVLIGATFLLLLRKKNTAADGNSKERFISTEDELFTGSFADKWEEVKTDNRRGQKLQAAKDDSDDWEEVRASVAPAYRGQRSNIVQQNQNVPNEVASSLRMIPISSDFCCICGRPLDEGATPLAGLPSGAKAYIDRNCHKVLTIAASTDNVSEFMEAAKYLKNRAKYVDPELEQALTSFIHKGEARLNLNSFSL